MAGERPVFADVRRGMNLSVIPDHLQAGKQFDNIELRAISRESLVQVGASLRVFPQHVLSRIYRVEQGVPQIDPRIPRYNAVVVSEPEKPKKEGKPEVGIIHVSGGGGSARNSTTVSLANYEKFSEYTDWNIPFSAAISSSQCPDTLGDKFYRSFIENAAYQAATIAEYLQDHPVDNLLLVSHSLGSAEAQFIAPVLKRLLQIKGIDTKIAGLILEQPGGVYDMGVIEFLKGVQKTNTLWAEIRERYPLHSDMDEVLVRLDEAIEFGDWPTAQRLQSRLNAMMDKYTNPQGLTSAQRERIQEDNKRIEEEKKFRKKKKQAAKRDKWLKKEVIDVTMRDTETRTLNFFELWKMNIRLGKETLLNRSGFMKRTPEWVRNLNEFPTAVIWARRDSNFPAEDGLLGMFKGLDGNSEVFSPFPFSPKLYIAQVESGHHIAITPFEYSDTLAQVGKELVEGNLQKGYQPVQIHRNQDLKVKFF